MSAAAAMVTGGPALLPRPLPFSAVRPMPQTPRQSRTPTASPPDAARPSEVVRAAVTAGLILCLIGLLLSIAGNSDSGSSALVRTLKGRLFSPWMTPPWLDLGFDYRLSYGSPEDADHAVDIRRHGDDRGGMSLPGTLTGERAARWRRLARAIALDADDADRDGLLAAAVGRGMFDDLGGEDVMVRVVRTPPTDRGAAAAAAAPAYTARVRMARGELQLLRQEARAEVAPLVEPPAAPIDTPARAAP
jgi:hypothetical protein